MGQNPSVEALWQSFEKENDPQNKLQLLMEISEIHGEVNSNEAITVTYQALALALEINSMVYIFDCYTNLGFYYDSQAKMDSTFYYYDKALAIAIELNDPYCIAQAKNNLGIHYLFKGNYSLALRYLLEALSDDIIPGEDLNHVITLSNIGVIYEEFGNMDLALEYYKRSAEAALIREEPHETAYAKLSFGYIAHAEKNIKKPSNIMKRRWLFIEISKCCEG